MAFGANQAVDDDYKNQDSNVKYTRGHVYPHCMNCEQDQAESTFTLTNAAPQTDKDNNQWSKEVEEKQKREIDADCDSKKAHVVTGVIPGTNFIKKRVNIPSHYWSAFSCKKKNENACMAQGYLLEMTGDGTSKAVQYQSIDALNEVLKNLYRLDLFKVFSKANPSVGKWSCGIL